MVNFIMQTRGPELPHNYVELLPFVHHCLWSMGWLLTWICYGFLLSHTAHFLSSVWHLLPFILSVEPHLHLESNDFVRQISDFSWKFNFQRILLLCYEDSEYLEILIHDHDFKCMDMIYHGFLTEMYNLQEKNPEIFQNLCIIVIINTRVKKINSNYELLLCQYNMLKCWF